MQKKIKQAKKYLEWEKPDQAIAELKPAIGSKQIQQEYRWVPNHMMGIALSLKGEHKASAGYLEKAVDYGSDQPETYHMLSVNYFNLAQFEDAEQFGREAVERRDDFLKAWLNLGSVYRSQAKLDEALDCYKKANELDPSNAGVAFRIGEIYRDQGDLKQAKKLFDITLQIEENHIQAMLEKADIYKKQGNVDGALENIDRARDVHGDRTPITISEAEIYKAQGKYDDAIALYEELLQKHPDSGALRVNYALCLQEISRFDESEKHYRRAIEDMVDPKDAISNYLMGLHYNPKNSKEHIYKEHVRLGTEFMPENSAGRAISCNTDPNKKLKVGFVSGGFRRHPVGWMIAGALEQLPEDDFELYCYTTNNKFDFVTRRIHKSIDTWRSIVGYSANVIENIIRDDELDILVDLSGHAADNCLDVMANEPAPVIVKWVGGLFNTTGIEAFNYLITEEFESPEGEGPYYTEKLVRMPDDYITFTPPAYAPDVDRLPAKENGYVTFGCFNNPTKVNDVVLRKWAEIMRQVPESHLYLKSKQYDTDSFREQILDVMSEEDIGQDRIKFEGHTSHDAHLEAYNDVDIALDPWPYSGGLTTCEALYMGVPVITMPGPTFAGRHSTTHLMNAGLEQWVTDSWEEYTEKAVALANNRDELEQWRSTLRSKLRNSPVCDGKRFGAHLSVALREMWKQWVQGHENDIEDWQSAITVKALSDDEINALTDGPEVTPLITIKDEGHSKQKSSMEKNNNTETMNESVLDTEKLVRGIEQLENGNGAGKESPENSPSTNGSVDSKQKENYSIETKDGITICTPPDTDILTTYVLLEQEEWFEPELDFVRQFLQPGMTVIDAGAGFGTYSLPMAKRVGVDGAVYAFEPGAVAKKHLEMSKMENGFDHLEVVGRGLGENAGEFSFEIAETPELNRVSEQGEKTVSLTSLDAWWGFAGKPEINFLKVDVNGMEAEVLAGGSWMFEETKPVVLAAIGENGESFLTLHEQLKEYGYQLFEYISGPEVLAEYDMEAGIDPYMMNVIGIPESRAQEFKENGWIFDESVKVEATDQHRWKQMLENQPWAESKVDAWADKVSVGNHKEYIEALNLACAAEQMQVSADDPASRSRKGATMLAAAQKLIALFNSGKAGVAAAQTYVRLMNQLGKRTQAVEMAKQLMETVNSGQSITVELPFLPPLSEQDKTDVQTEFKNWLTVRVVETWIALQNPTTYMAGEQEQGMLEALEGNPEVAESLSKAVGLVSDANTKSVKGKLNNWWDAGKDTKPPVATVNGKANHSNPLKHLYLGYPGKKGGAHGIHEIRVQKIANEIEKQGIQTSFISTSGSEFLEALYKVKDNEGYAFYSGVMGYDLKVHAEMGISGNVFDLINIPVFGFLGDHPYTDFMWSRIVNSADNATFLTAIPSLKKEMQEIFPNTSIRQIGDLFPLSAQNEDLKPIEDRSIDVLIPWGIHKFFANQKSLKQQLKELGPRHKELGLAIYDEVIWNHQKSILDSFGELHQVKFGNRYQFDGTKSKEDFRWLKVLSIVDWTIRKDRRVKMLREQLSSLPENSRAVVTANQKVAELIPELKEKNNIEWIGQISKEKLNKLYKDSKIVLNCNPTYVDNVHPRVYEGISNGCFLVSDFNSALKETFWEEDTIGIIGEDSGSKLLKDYLSEDCDVLQRKVDRGQEIVQQSFTAEKHAESIIEVITEKMI